MATEQHVDAERTMPSEVVVAVRAAFDAGFTLEYLEAYVRAAWRSMADTPDGEAVRLRSLPEIERLLEPIGCLSIPPGVYELLDRAGYRRIGDVMCWPGDLLDIPSMGAARLTSLHDALRSIDLTPPYADVVHGCLASFRACGQNAVLAALRAALSGEAAT